MTAQPMIHLERVTKVYPGSTTPAVEELTMDINEGEILVLVGPSGCGKTTTLRMIAGLEDTDEGEIYIGKRRVNDLPPKARNVAMVFQNFFHFVVNIKENWVLDHTQRIFGLLRRFREIIWNDCWLRWGILL